MGPGCFFPTNPDLANLLGRTDFDSEKVFLFFTFWVPRFPDQALARLGPGWTGPGRAGPGPFRAGL